MVRTAIGAAARDQRREGIMTVAREVFFEVGYAAASMSMIAARLGGSKGTLYNYFKNKEELFEAQVRDVCGHAADRIIEATSEQDPAQALQAFGEKYLHHLYNQQTVHMFRILVAESQRRPELGRMFYEVGPARGRKALQTYLEGAKALGKLDPPDCALAADQFLSLCKGPAHLQFMLNLIPPLTGEEIRAHVSQTVACFVRLYAGEPQGHSEGEGGTR
jgi:AcrR family transcriptional regulator